MGQKVYSAHKGQEKETLNNMISYRRARTVDDWGKVHAYCFKAKVEIPTPSQIVFYAYDEDAKETLGVVALKVMHFVEPLVSDNPKISQVLGEKALALLSAVEPPLAYAMVKSSRESWIEILKKYEFEVIDEGMVILRKEV